MRIRIVEPNPVFAPPFVPVICLHESIPESGCVPGWLGRKDTSTQARHTNDAPGGLALARPPKPLLTGPKNTDSQKEKGPPNRAALSNFWRASRCLHHAAHAAHVGHSATSATGAFFGRLVGNHGLGGDQQASN